MALISETWEARIVVVTQKEEFFKKVLSSRFEKKGEERERRLQTTKWSRQNISLSSHIFSHARISTMEREVALQKSTNSELGKKSSELASIAVYVRVFEVGSWS